MKKQKRRRLTLSTQLIAVLSTHQPHGVVGGNPDTNGLCIGPMPDSQECAINNTTGLNPTIGCTVGRTVCAC
jgi:hypothetical protein